MLEEKGTKISTISTVKQVLYQHNLKGHSEGRSHCFKTSIKKTRLRFATEHGDKVRTFWRNVLWSDETKIELFGNNDNHYVWRKRGRLASRRTPSQPWSMGVAASWCGGALLQEGLVHIIDGIMRKEQYVDILKQHQDIGQEVKAWSQMGLPNGQRSKAYFQSCGKMA